MREPRDMEGDMTLSYTDGGKIKQKDSDIRRMEREVYNGIWAPL